MLYMKVAKSKWNSAKCLDVVEAKYALSVTMTPSEAAHLQLCHSVVCCVDSG